jgi:replicative DNA helicase
MIEQLMINKVLKDKSLKPLKDNGIEPEHFLSPIAREQVQFILDHFQTYGVVPDYAVFLEKYTDFDVLDVAESSEYLSYRLKEAFLYKDTVPVVKEFERLLRDDSVKAVQYLKEEIDKLIKNNSIRVGRGYDIIRNADDRLQEYERRTQVSGLLGISTGIPLLDELTHGWVGEDLVVILARTNVGKTWIMLYFLVKAWCAGNIVLLYSGEMSRELMGFRFDTLLDNWSNAGLMNGKKFLGDDREMEDYKRYIDELKEKEGFIVVTPKDFGGKKPNSDDLRGLMQYYNADILGVDQISLMTDKRRGENKRIQYTNISEDLFLLSEELQKPILCAAQANRDAVKNKKDKDASPELHEVGESDGIAQNATRVISLNVVDNILKLSIKKNRYGINNRDVLMLWDINYGKLKPLLEEGIEQAETSYGF